MAIIRADESTGWNLSRFIPPGVNPNSGGLGTDGAVAYGPDNGTAVSYDTGYFSDVTYNLQAVGYSNIPENRDASASVGDVFFFKGFSGSVSITDFSSGSFSGFGGSITDIFYTDELTVPDAGPGSPSLYIPTLGPVGLIDAVNTTDVTFFGNNSKTDVVRVGDAGITFSGNDHFYGYGGNDILEGGAGDDLLDGGTGNDLLTGGIGNDRMFGGNEVDRLEGGAGDDTLDGGTGNDVMVGGTGDDTYFVDSLYDTVVEQSGQGTDTVFSSISFAAPGPVENVTLTGLADINATGNGLKNTLIGNAGINVLNGGAWDDTLDGKGGADTLIGGTGFDTFVFHKGEANGDTIQDFTGLGKAFGDKIVFEDYGADAHLVKLTSAIYAIVDDESVELITIKGPVDASDYLFV